MRWDILKSADFFHAPGQHPHWHTISEMIDKGLCNQVVREGEMRHYTGNLGLVITSAFRTPGPEDRVMFLDHACRNGMKNAPFADLTVG